MSREKIQTLILSDIHLGSPWCRQDLLINVLNKYDCRTLILNGDTIHGDDRQYPWNPNLIAAFFNLYKIVDNIIWINGNHDDFLNDFRSICIDKISFTENYYHKGINGKLYLITHGQYYNYAGQYKPKLKFYIGSRLYKIYLKFKYSPLTWIKNKLFKRPESFSKWCRKLAKSRNCDGIIAGHVHEPKIDTSKEILYYNSGDWVENMSYIIENLNGTFELKIEK